MSVAKVTEIIASSNKSFEDAVSQGVARADKTLNNITSAWVKDQNVVVENGKVTEYRVVLKVTFVLKD
ncbi:MAG: dodecin family protein [Pseudomonadota bacterium]